MYKAKQKTVSLMVACLTFLVSVVMAFACLFGAPTINVASAAASYTETAFGEGTFLITTTYEGKTYYLPATTTSNAPVATAFTDVSEIGEDHLWTVTATGSNFYIQNSEGKYLYTTSSNNGVRVGTTQGTWIYDASKNSLQFTSTSRFLGIYNAQDWRSYNTVDASNYGTSSTSFVFYMVDCAHTSTTTTTVDATCETAGSTTVTCNGCGETISTTVIPALGHDVESKPVSNNDGTHTYSGVCNTCQETIAGEVENCAFERAQDEPKYTCTECGYFYTVNEYTVSFSVPSGVTAVESVKVEEGKSIALPTADNYDKYTFVGWTTEEYESNTEKPEFFKAESEYEVTGTTTFYTLYSYSVGGASGWTKVTEAPSDWSGEYLIVCEESNVAFNGTLETLDASANKISVAIADGTIAATDETNVASFTIEKVGDDYAIKSASGYYIGNTADSNKLLSSDSEKYTNTISLNTDGTVQIVGSGSSVLRYNATTDQERFRYFKSSTYTKQKAIYLYELGTGTTYYTTGEAVQPEPTPETKITDASLTLGETLTMNYYVTLLNEHAGATMSFTMNGETTVVEGVEADGQYVFSFEIPPQYMATTINAKLIFEDVVIAEKLDYSIKQYAQNLLNENPNDELKQLLTDLLYYGDAAYNFVNETTGETPVTSGVENIGEVSTATPATNFTLVDNDQINEYPAYFVAAGVWFDNVNKLYVKLNTTENVTLKINNVEVEVTGKTVYTEGIIATDFDETFIFELSCNGVVMQTLTYSVNAYATAMNSDALALALYRYGASAEAYAN